MISYIEPRYPTPASAAVRGDLVKTDWGPLDCSFRAYVEGQAVLELIGFTAQFAASDLPAAFIQEELGGNRAPLIAPPLRSPASAAVVIARIRELRGQ